MVASVLKIIIAQNTICDNLVSFPKSGHIELHKQTCVIVCVD